MYIPAYTHLHQSLHLMLHIIPWKLQPESAQKAWPRFHLQDATCMCVEPLKHVCRRKAVAHVASGLDRGQVCHHGGTWAGACQCVAKPHAEGHNAQAGDGCLQMEWVSGKQIADRPKLDFALCSWWLALAEQSIDEWAPLFNPGYGFFRKQLYIRDPQKAVVATLLAKHFQWSKTKKMAECDFWFPTCRWSCRRALPSSVCASKQTKRSPLDFGVVERWGKRGVMLLWRVCADQRTWRDRSSRTKTGPRSDLFVDVYQSVRQTKINMCAFTHTPCRISWSQIKMSRLFQSGG